MSLWTDRRMRGSWWWLVRFGVLAGLVGTGSLLWVTPASAGSCATLDPFDTAWASSYLASVGGVHLAAAVEDLATGCRFHLGADDAFPPASTVKAEILGAALLQQEDAGAISVPAWLSNLAVPMITESDNDATSALYDAVGGGAALSAYGRRLGLTVTDNSAFDWGGSPTTPDDQLALLHSLLVGGGALGPTAVAYARSLMSSVDGDQAWGVSAGVPAGSSVFLKNGWLFNDGTMWGRAGYWRVNSIGMVQLPNGRQYTVAVFGDEWSTMDEGIRAIETLSRHVAAMLAAPRAGVPVAELAASVLGSSPSVPSTFTASSPTRVLDTRRTGRPVAAGGEVVVDIAAALADLGGAPPAGTLTAAALNLTAVDAVGAGYLTAYPDGGARPLASNVNQSAGSVTANLAVVPVGADGKVRIFTSTATGIVVDLLGTWSTIAGAGPLATGTATGRPVAAGRVVTTTPTRLLDTRSAGATLGTAGQLTVAVAGRAGVPATGAAAVLVNVTATDTPRAGYWTVWPGAAERPLASNLNTGAGETAANTTLVPLGPDGTISVYSQSGGDVVVDVLGWVTDSSAPAATAGELVALGAPSRALDTRFGDGGLDRLVQSSASPVVLQTVGVPAGASAVVANLTYAAPTSDGYLSAYPAGGARPVTSSANPSVLRGTGANALVTGLTGGSFVLYASVSTDAIVDVGGWFTS